jgi:hypothetical protein
VALLACRFRNKERPEEIAQCFDPSLLPLCWLLAFQPLSLPHFLELLP